MGKVQLFDVVAGAASILLNQPPGLTAVYEELIRILNEGGYLVDTEPITTAAQAKALVSGHHDPHIYYTVKSTEKKVWSHLAGPVSDGKILVIALVSGTVPSCIPHGLVSVDVGGMLRGRVPKAVARELIESLETKGRMPMGDYEKLFHAALELCYEVVYRPELAIFPESLHRVLYVSTAFDFIYNPPPILTQDTMRAAVYDLVSTVHGNLG